MKVPRCGFQSRGLHDSHTILGNQVEDRLGAREIRMTAGTGNVMIFHWQRHEAEPWKQTYKATYDT